MNPAQTGTDERYSGSSMVELLKSEIVRENIPQRKSASQLEKAALSFSWRFPRLEPQAARP